MEKPYVVGIDIGGTNTVFGVVDARGTILYSGSIKTGKYADVNDYVAELAKGLKSVIDQAGGPDKIKGVGVGAPNGNFFNGCIEFAPNLPWKGKIPLAQLISEQIDGIPVALTNDATEIFLLLLLLPHYLLQMPPLFFRKPSYFRCFLSFSLPFCFILSGFLLFCP